MGSPSCPHIPIDVWLYPQNHLFSQLQPGVGAMASIFASQEQVQKASSFGAASSWNYEWVRFFLDQPFSGGWFLDFMGNDWYNLRYNPYITHI